MQKNPSVLGSKGKIKYRSYMNRMKGSIKSKIQNLPYYMWKDRTQGFIGHPLTDVTRSLQKSIRKRVMTKTAPKNMMYYQNVPITYAKNQLNPLNTPSLRNGNRAARFDLHMTPTNIYQGKDDYIKLHSMKINPKRGAYGNFQLNGKCAWTSENNAHVSVSANNRSARISARTPSTVRRMVSNIRKREIRAKHLYSLPEDIIQHIALHAIRQ